MLTLNAILVAAIVVQRLVELGISRAHRRQLVDEGAIEVADAAFPWMVGCHVLLLAGSGLEPWLLERPFIPVVGWIVFALLIGTQGVRVWALVTLGRHWNVRIIASGAHGIVTGGPYRLVRHPNYAVVIAETMLLPLFHGAWLTLVAVQLIHIPVLARRIRAEEDYLMSLPDYRESMADKPRFLPRFR